MFIRPLPNQTPQITIQNLNLHHNGTTLTLRLQSILSAKSSNTSTSMVTQFSPKPTEPDHHSPSSDPLFSDRNCCFFVPYRWRKVPSSDHEDNNHSTGTGSLWSRGIAALKKIREWSEIVAGPKWKTFIRRFNRSKSSGRQVPSKFQYDPLSYALNFDQGPLENGDPETENEYMVRNFSSRYVLPPSAISITGKTVVDDEFGPGFV